jgi:tRNA-specific adenosine deaminase 1
MPNAIATFGMEREPPLKRRAVVTGCGSDRLCDGVANAVLRRYGALPKTGKPQPNEHTVLAGFVLEAPGSELRCVALGTGMKCLSAEKRSPSGNLINDSHAVTCL